MRKKQLDEDRLALALTEHELRQREALRLFRPLPTQMRAFLSTASEFLARGGNRSSKTTTIATLFSSIVTGIPVIGPDGHPIPFPRYYKRPMLAWCVGYDQRHIGQTLHRVLFEPGLFQIIKDKDTDLWRTYQPWTDLDREQEAVPAQPLIPSRLIEDIDWESNAGRIFNTVKLKDGTKICAYPSTGEPKQGDAPTIIWIDEDVRWSRHIAEWQARLSDNKGRLLWSAFPHSKNNALIRMSDRAEEQKDRLNKDVEEIVLKFSDNPWMDRDEVRKRIAGWSDEERRARDYGEFTYDTILMYDYTPALHDVPNPEGAADPINKIYLERGNFPRHWTRYLVLDPGHTTCAVILAVIPPVEEDGVRYTDSVIIEDEVYLHRATAPDVAKAVAPKVAGKQYESFIIDMHAGKQTPMGTSKRVVTLYAEAFAKYGITCRRTGSHFTYGSDNLESRRETLRAWMQTDDYGRTKFRIVKERTKNLQNELKNYRKRIMDNVIEDKPTKSPHDAIDGLEYLAGFNPRWVDPGEYATRGSGAYRKAMKLLKRETANSYVHLGPGEAA